MAKQYKLSFVTSAKDCETFIQVFPSQDKLCQDVTFYTVTNLEEDEPDKNPRSDAKIVPYSWYFILRIEKEFGLKVAVKNGYT